MRLTLRYLLAYLHGLDLSPEDAQEIERRIQESERARKLVHRIRDVVRRLRLGAPSVMDRGQWLDPNTVAEYLDHRLPDTQVPDFEKVCLESDVQLAEVASCHEILSRVLREPAEVDPVSRQRMYHLAEALAQPAIPAATEPTGQAKPSDGSRIPAEPSATPGARWRVPEYLRRGARRPWWRTLAGLGLAAAVLLAVLVVSGQIRPRELAWQWWGSGASTPSVRQEPARGEPAPPGTGQGAPAAPAEEPKSIEPKPPQSQGESEGPGDQAAPSAKSPAVPEPGTVGPAKKSPPGEAVAADGVRPGTEPGEMPAGSISEGPGAKAEPTEPSPPKPGEHQGGLVHPPSVLEPQPRLPVTDAAVPPPAPVGKTVIPAERVGVLSTAREVLLRQNPATGSWLRVAEQGQVTSQDRVVSLPLSRPVVQMPSANVEVRFVDAASARFLPSATVGVPGVAVEFGRLLLRPLGKGPARVRLEVGEHRGMLIFGDADSTVAIDVARSPNPGADPETQPGPVLADLYATSGKILWEEQGGAKPVSLAAPIRATLGGKPLELDMVALQQFPRWVYESSLDVLEQQAAAVMERSVTLDRPASLSLRELAEHRRREIRLVAIRSLAILDDYGPLLDALNNPDERLQWDEYVEVLRTAVARGPKSAAHARTLLEDLYGDQGTALYEMLWKYQADTLNPADARTLVQYLDHEVLVFRVLAFWNLRMMTGLQFRYRPEDPAQKRQPAIARWRERLSANPTLRPRPGEEEKSRPGEPTKTPIPDKPALPAKPLKAAANAAPGPAK